MNNAAQPSGTLNLDKLEVLALKADGDDSWRYYTAFQEEFIPSTILTLIAQARATLAPVAAQQAASVELRGCTSCEWTGDTDRMCGSIGPLCPECGDTTEFLGQRSAAKAPAAQAVDAPNLLNAEELAALRRFDECAQDGEGYDVPKEMMQRLAEIGVVRRKSGAYYEETDFGKHVLGNAIQVEAAGTLGYAIFRNGKQQGIERRRGDAENWVNAQIVPLVAASPASTPEASQQADEEKLRALLESEFDCYRTTAGLIPWAINALLDNSPHRIAPVGQAAAVAAPSGCKVVPVYPTEEMKQAGYHAPHNPGLPGSYHAIMVWKAMVAAAPATAGAATTSEDAPLDFHKCKQRIAEALGVGNSMTIHGVAKVAPNAIQKEGER